MDPASMSDRVRALGLPADKLVVIGSGILGALGLRESRDIDLVVSEELFAELPALGWHGEVRHDETVMLKGDAEAWLSWLEPAAKPNFKDLYESGREIDGIRYCDPRAVLAWKRASGREKDVADVALLEEYLKNHE